ncbi:DUF6287 domain-containing protein [Streptococcus sp. BJSWXB6CM1]|uniref:DUF6287 domain-containing protein n=1 Tax=Streptococcus sp. BJSWXB6CM1 TaxID=3095081 RepID=UPI002A80A8DF|nr:DUF6287 domain-containing protein [Streptococcus sp. BJSWXB6CM1]MDY4371772.1 DUF6287 domain-containing protein [Streptococcus sp. BJSWXB6CM1]
MRIGKGINWILILLSCLIAIVLISFMFFFNHKKHDAEAVNTTTEQVSTTSSTTTASTTTASSTTASTTTASSTTASTTTASSTTASTTPASTTTTSSTTTQDSVTTTEEKPSIQEEQTNAESPKIDEQAILNGDFSTLVGTWRNGLGQEFTFDKNGLVNSGNIEKSSIGNDGSINFSVRTGNTGFGMSIYPAGTTMKWVDSDPSKNRLIAGQAAPTNPEEVFYKVD